MNKEVFLREREMAAELYTGGGSAVLDMGFSNRAAWASGNALLEELLLHGGEVSFGELAVNGCNLPTLDLFLDDPAGLSMPRIRETENGTLYEFPEAGAAVALLRALPQDLSSLALPGCVTAVTRECGLIASILRAYLQTLDFLGECAEKGIHRENMVWGWSSILLAPLCDDKTVTLARQETVNESGAVMSLWVRCRGDDEIRTLAPKLRKRGEVRLQNLTTANTFCIGKLSAGRLKAVFGPTAL